MQPAKQQPQQQTRGEKTYYIAPNDEHEQRIAQAWLDKHGIVPNTPGQPRFVTELRVDRLTNEHCVRVLARTGKRTPFSITVKVDGMSQVVRKDPEELVHEIVESAPVDCSKHWLERGDHEEGELIVSSFLGELGARAVPFAVKWRPDDGRKVRLAWA